MFKRWNRKNAQALSAASRNVIETLETRTLLSGNVETVDAVLSLSGDRVLLAGYNDQGDQIQLVRLTSTGGVDTLFGGGDGHVEITFGGTSDKAIDLAQDDAGNLYVAGITDANPTGGIDFAVTRLTADGDQDPSFAGGGAALADFNAGGMDFLKRIVVSGTGASTRVVLVGSTTSVDYSDMAVAAFDSSGAPIFSAAEETPGIQDSAVGAVITGSGVIVGVGADAAWSPQNTVTLKRYNDSGTVDGTFGIAGQVIIDYSAQAELLSLLDDGAGNVLAVSKVVDPGPILVFSTYSQADGSEVGSASDLTIYEQFDVTGAGIGGGKVVVSGFVPSPSGPVAALAASYDLVDLGGTRNWVATAPFADVDVPRSVVDADVTLDGGVVLAANINALLLPGAEFDYQAQLIDDAGEPSTIYTAGFGDEVINTAPVVDPIVGPSSGLVNTELEFSGTYSDPGDLGGHGFEWVVTDASNTEVASGIGTAFPWTPTSLGTYTVTFTVTDSGNLSGSASAVVNVTSAAIIDGVLTVNGDANANVINVTLNSLGQYSVVVGNLPAQFFAAALVNSISIDGGDGNDSILLSSQVTAPAVINGGDGDDAITGGSGSDVLLGGAGDDALYGSNGNDGFDGGAGDDLVQGGNGRDVLVGGDDADTIAGNNGDDLLIAGIYSGGDLVDLVAVWNGGGSYATRVSILQTGLLNGTVANDQDDDLLTGNNGTDLFVTDSGDWVLDVTRKESTL